MLNTHILMVKKTFTLCYMKNIFLFKNMKIQQKKTSISIYIKKMLNLLNFFIMVVALFRISTLLTFLKVKIYSNLSHINIHYHLKLGTPPLYYQFLKRISHNPEYIQTFCNDRRNPFHFACRIILYSCYIHIIINNVK